MNYPIATDNRFDQTSTKDISDLYALASSWCGVNRIQCLRAGIEPATHRLLVCYSTFELSKYADIFSNGRHIEFRFSEKPYRIDIQNLYHMPFRNMAIQRPLFYMSDLFTITSHIFFPTSSVVISTSINLLIFSIFVFVCILSFPVLKLPPSLDNTNGISS